MPLFFLGGLVIIIERLQPRYMTTNTKIGVLRSRRQHCVKDTGRSLRPLQIIFPEPRKAFLTISMKNSAKIRKSNHYIAFVIQNVCLADYNHSY